MQQHPLVSVLLSIYKVEKYLGECLDSILAQSYTNLEIVCVNNGSPDKCGEILEKYAKKDKRIKVITLKENRMLCGGRNAALDNATGEFICFVDPDDWIEKDHIKSMVETVLVEKDPDGNEYNLIINYAAKNFLSNNNSIIEEYDYKTGCYSADEGNKNPFFEANIPAWGRLYRTSFLKKCNAHFSEGFNTDNIPFMYILLSNLKYQYVISRNTHANIEYWRRINENTATSEVIYNNFEIPQALGLLYTYLKNNNKLNNVKIPFLLFFNIAFLGHKNKPKLYLEYKNLCLKMENDIKDNNIYNESDKYLCDCLVYSASYFEFCKYYAPASKPTISAFNLKLFGFLPLVKFRKNEKKSKFYLFNIPILTFRKKRILLFNKVPLLTYKIK